MKPILGPAGLAALRQFAHRNTLMAFDYDGTLAPIVTDPAQARMRPRTHTLLAQVTRRYPTVIITGRSRHDLLRLLHGIASLEVIGNHGLETDGVSSTRYARRVEQWRASLPEDLTSIPGLLVENKRYSLALHYRHCPDPEAARAAIEEISRTLNDIRLVGGKKVVNLIPAEAPDKGRALMAAGARLGCTRAIYTGDDDTDEDVFSLNRPESILTIRVGHDPDSSAQYYLRAQDDIDAVLEALLEHAAGAGTAGQSPANPIAG